MVHIVKKKVGDISYLSLQRSIRKGKKVYTEHVAYLGKESEISKEQLKELIKQHEVGKK